MKTSTDCHCQHEIPRDGSGQRQRYLKALDPTYAPIDERSLEELLVYARRYAAQIRFWPLPDDQPGAVAPAVSAQTEAESWREFFRRDWAVVAASVAVVDLAQIQKDYDEIRAGLEESPTRDEFRALFDPILGIARRLDRWYTVALPGHPLHDDLTLLIDSVLRPQMALIIEYDETFRTISANKALNLDYTDFENPDCWGIGEDVNPGASIYEGDDIADQLRNAALYVDAVFQAFYNALRRLVDDSDQYMQFALEEYPAHQPYMALFIAFLELFRLAQDQLNTLPQKHLEFYYRDVLRLAEQPAQPDHVHLVLELAQDVPNYLLPKGTALLAGQDATGKDLIYRLSDDFVASQTQVKDLKTIRLAKAVMIAENGLPVTTIRGLYARPVAKSKDGFGQPFDDSYGKWDAFGKGDVDLNTLTNPCDLVRATADVRTDQLAIGFAIASPQLLLQSGHRKIEFALDGLQSVIQKPKALKIWLTGEKEWFQVTTFLDDDALIKALEGQLNAGMFQIPEALEKNEQIQKTGFYFVLDNTLHIYLPMSVPAVIAYSPKIHGGLADSVVQPVLKILIDDSFGAEADFSKPFPLSRLQIRTRVGSIPKLGNNIAGAVSNPLEDLDGLKDLVLQNDAGLIDPNQPFDPFTAYPGNFSSFYAGSDEIFNKPPGRIALQVDRGDGNIGVTEILTDTERNSVGILYNRKWNSPKVFFSTALRTPILPVTVLDKATQKGFIRWTIGGQPGSIGETLTHVDANANLFLAQQQLALQLRIKSVALSYDSTLTQLEKGIDQFLHIYPFGVADVTDRIDQVPLWPQFVYPNAPKVLAQRLAQLDSPVVQSAASVRMINRTISATDYLPVLLSEQIKTADRLNQYTVAAELPDAAVQEEGFLCIGLANLKPLQTLSLLFQIAEGTAEDEDYTEDPPEIHWSYVVNDEIRPLLPERIIADGTYGLQTPGLIKFDIPADITTTNTILPSGMSWLCASVTEHADRVPKLIDIKAQALEAVFDDQQNDPTHYENLLPADSISKLVTQPAEVKKVEQPFASFDGKPQETGPLFYTRVSERLRHKARAINTWDYEHLLLDQFPHTYKVKCITHTDPNCLCRTNATGADCCGPQVAPGHVLIVPISDFKNRNAVNPLQPKTSYRVLRSMEAFLKKRISPFVTVHARNPRYEEVIVTFRVKFYEGVDKGFHLKKLNDEIVRYLTPWAFDETADVSFSQKIYASAVINFIEERPYVDFITDFKMGVCKEECCPPAPANATGKPPEGTLADILKDVSNCDDLEQLLEGSSPWQVAIEPSTARSLVVSVPQHLILLYQEEPVETPCDKRKTS